MFHHPIISLLICICVSLSTFVYADATGAGGNRSQPPVGAIGIASPIGPVNYRAEPAPPVPGDIGARAPLPAARGAWKPAASLPPRGTEPYPDARHSDYVHSSGLGNIQVAALGPGAQIHHEDGLISTEHIPSARADTSSAFIVYPLAGGDQGGGVVHGGNARTGLMLEGRFEKLALMAKGSYRITEVSIPAAPAADTAPRPRTLPAYVTTAAARASSTPGASPISQGPFRRDNPGGGATRIDIVLAEDAEAPASATAGRDRPDATGQESSPVSTLSTVDPPREEMIALHGDFTRERRAAGKTVSQSSSQAAGLEAALHATLTRHPAIRGKQAEVDAKRFTGDSVRAERYPTLSAELGVTDDNTALTARQPLWAFNRIDSAIAYADTDVMAEQADLLRIRRQLLEETAVAYTKVLDIRWRQQISVDDIASHKRLFKQIDRRARGQLASETDVRLASARLVQSRARKSRVDGELRVALAELEALTQTHIAVEQSMDTHFTQLPDIDMLEAATLRESADIRFKEMLLALARADVEKQRTLHMPTVYLRADHTRTNDSDYRRDDDTRIGIFLEGSFDGMGFISKGRHQAAAARLEAAREDLETTRDELLRQIRTLIANRQVQSRLTGVLDASVQELQATLDSYERQYEAGHKAWLDVLNIQRELTEQRLQQTQAENEWLIYSLRIAALIGALDKPYDFASPDHMPSDNVAIKETIGENRT